MTSLGGGSWKANLEPMLSSSLWLKPQKTK